MRVVPFIFARGGSKGLPRKNLYELDGKPLIAWSIECILSIPTIEKVFVSTDSQEIAKVAREFGAEVPFIRPSELAEDDTPEWLAWRHAINFLKSSSGKMPDALLSIPSTAPLRSSDDIVQCLEEFSKGDCDAVIAVSEASRNPYFNMVSKDQEGFCSLLIEQYPNTYRRQDAPQVFDISTVCYVVRSDLVLSKNSIFEGRVKAVEVPRERAIDIDSMLDIQIAESILKTRKSEESVE